MGFFSLRIVVSRPKLVAILTQAFDDGAFAPKQPDDRRITTFQMTLVHTPLTVAASKSVSLSPGEPPLVLSIEGNIGIGKSTLLGNLRKRYAADPDVVFVDEPVEQI